MALPREARKMKYSVLDLFSLICIIVWEFILKVSNLLGIAWWARIQTVEPDAIYWFGPFLSHRALTKNLKVFLNDIQGESPRSVKYKEIQAFFPEPLTTEPLSLQANRSVCNGTDHTDVDLGNNSAVLSGSNQSLTSSFVPPAQLSPKDLDHSDKRITRHHVKKSFSKPILLVIFSITFLGILFAEVPSMNLINSDKSEYQTN